MQDKDLLVLYDYGEGAVWAYVRASSREEIETAYPELFVVDGTPESMTEVELASLPRLDVSFPSGLLHDLLQLREVEERHRYFHSVDPLWPDYLFLGQRPARNK
jgi:hypothetical protein